MTVRAESCLLALLASTVACTGIGNNFREPDIQLEQAILRGVSVTGGNLDLLVKVDNPNNFSLHGTKLEAGVDVEGQHLGTVTYDNDFAVSENGVTRITLPLRFGWAGVGSAVRAALGHGELPYKMKGQAELRVPWGQVTVPFTREGRVPLIRSGGNIAIPGQSQ